MQAIRNRLPDVHGTMKGRVIYLLIFVIIVQTTYPITESGSFISFTIYNLMYTGLIITGVVLTRGSRWLNRALIGTGIIWFLAGLLFAVYPNAIWVQLVSYLAILAFMVSIISVLLQFIFSTNQVNLNVLYAATAVYIMLGAMFVPIYGIIIDLTFWFESQAAFVDGANPEVVVLTWQTLIYYSYATLTTLGYGDILPVTMVARSAASVQAVIGVLYTAIIIARLVGLYAAESVENYDAMKAQQTEE